MASRVCAFLTVIAACGCSPGAAEKAPLRVSASHGDTISGIQLDRSLNEIARGSGKARDLKPILETSGATLDIGTIADVRFIGTANLAVLDRRSRHVLVLDEQLTSPRRVGRPGAGPGEFADPWAMVAVGRHLVVLQTVDPVFILFDSSGAYVRSAARPTDGDWRNPLFRAPSLRSDDMQNSPEDVKRRLRADGDSAFFHILQPNESPMGKDSFDLASPPAYVMRYALDLRVRDTVAVMRAPPLTIGKVRAGGWQDYDQDLFASWPLIATGDGWIAFAHGDSASIGIRWTTPATPTVLITWPDDRPEIKEAHKDAANRWLMLDAFRASADFENTWKLLPEGRRKQILDEHKKNYLRFSKRAPNITKLYGSGACLFATGFNVEDNPDAVSRAILAINIDTGVADVIRIADRDETLRDFSPERIVTTRRDDNGEWYLRIYEHGVSC